MSENYVFSSGPYSVLWCDDGFTVTRTQNNRTETVGVAWELNADGCGCAVAYATYKNTKRGGRDAAIAATEIGTRIFGIGKRNAYKNWLDQ